jgi:DnaK suppressor protein
LLAKWQELDRQRASAAEFCAYGRDRTVADVADLATQDGERAAASQLAEAMWKGMAEIDRALEKLDEGTYGTCDDCGRQIPVARLRAVPWATRCVSCQTEREQERREPETPRPRLTAWAAPLAAWSEEDWDISAAGSRAMRVR